MNSDDSEDKRRLFEYFIVAGLNDESGCPKELSSMSTAQPSSADVGKQTHHYQLAPITDICVIFTSSGETTPPDFERIETTPQGYPADLNHGSLRSPAAFVCYKRGYHKPPLIDLGVLDEGKGEKPMVDAVILDKTPYGLSANISNSSSSLFFTTRRAKADSPPHQLVITQICVILENKGERPPHTFYKIPKNLNKSMIGSEVYVCYKKSQLACKRIAYEPAVLDCFPRVQNIEASLLVRNVPMFFLPMGALIEAWPERCKNTEHHARTVSTCVFTDEAYTKYYGASITFYEPYTKPLSEQQLEKLDLGVGGGEEQPSNNNSSSTAAGQQQQDKIDDPTSRLAAKKDQKNTFYYCNKAICIVSRYPFFEPFRSILFFLLNTAASNSASRIPIERYISHLMYEVPFPSPARPRILVELGTDMIAFESSDDSQTPLTGANFVETLKNLGTDNLLYAMLLTLLEQKLLVHSLRPWLLTCVSETLCALMFPFSWNLPYIPQCPLPLAGIFHAPLSFMAGVDSRYFDLYEEPPSDVTCFDLDTATISQSAVRKLYQLSMLPKKPLKRLRATLDAISTKIGEKLAKKNSMDYEQTHTRIMQSEQAIREAFLRFICCLMDGYTDFLCPIMESPWAEGATDVRNLFDWEQFIQSRDKNAVEFYGKFRETTCFNRFIEERSGAIGGVEPNEPKEEEAHDENCRVPMVEDKSVFYVFFDDCIAKLRAEAVNAVLVKDKNMQNAIPPRLLLDADSMMANRTVVVPAPHVHSGEKREFNYVSFPQHFEAALFETEFITRSLLNRPMQQRNDGGTSLATSRRPKFFLLRTRQEVRKALNDAALLQQQNVAYWPRSVLFFAYTLWFMQLPALLAVAKNKRKMLLLGVRVLSRMEQIGVPFHDQVCYRLLMHLCGAYGRPEMAIIILRKMLNIGIIPNAITYKVYHKALIQSDWPSEPRLSAIAAWRRVQLRLEICSRFRLMLPNSSNILPSTVHKQDITTMSTTNTTAEEEEEDDESRDSSNIVQEIVPMKLIENDETAAVVECQTTALTNHINNNNNNNIAANRTTSNLLDPLGATALTNTVDGGDGSQKLRMPPPKPPRQQLQQWLMSTPTKPSAAAAAVPNNFRLLMSPSREKFIRDHSASPLFAREDEESEAGKNGGKTVEKRRRKSLRLGSSWLKSLANTSLNLINRSQTTENLDSISRDGSIISDARSPSTSSAANGGSPSFLSLANKMRKRAMRTYNEVLGDGVNELLERSGLNNPAQMFKEAKLNLSRSFRADQSGLSMVSSSDDNLFAKDQSGTMDLFYLCAQRTRDPVSIHYWMGDILPEDDSELKNVWLRHNADSTISQEEYLDVLVCSTSPCSNCDQLIYDDDLTIGWAVDDANLNAKCPQCQHTFLPSLKVCVQTRKQQQRTTNETNAMNDSTSETLGTPTTRDASGESASIPPLDVEKIVQSFTVPYISPLVLRRELETLVTSSADGALVLARPGMRIAHPIIFWNLFYYCRRLDLPTHLLTWVAEAVVIHCVQDMPRLPSATEQQPQQQVHSYAHQ
uniref:C-myc promoter-binding protein n=1 Tax=Globodera rostochiensis TaxID=31243 RepID=A0A914I9T6_GLORO